MSEVVELPFGVRLVVAYDGTDFCGWQAQPGQRAVQTSLEEAIDAMNIPRSRVFGASRTDSGVHAEGQVAAFAAGREIDAAGWIAGLNKYAPKDIAVREVAPCAPDYNPRFDAFGKTYRYLIQVGPVRDPLLRRQAWHVWNTTRNPLDLAAMHDACKCFQGKHDFRAFRSARDQRETTVRTLKRVQLIEGWRGQAELFAIEIDGDAFMTNMVRILVGTLIAIGRGRIAVDAIPDLLSEQAERNDAGMTAPAHGLTLVRIELGRASSRSER